MKVFIMCSKKNYGLVEGYAEQLMELGHEAIFPNCMANPKAEAEAKDSGNHTEFKRKMLEQSKEKIEGCDVVLILNPDRDGINGYIGGATFLEMYVAFSLGKKIYMTNAVEQKVFADEVACFAPCIIETITDIV